MINSIFENLFEPNSPEEVESRKPKPRTKIGDVWIAKVDTDAWSTDVNDVRTRVINVGDVLRVIALDYSMSFHEWNYDVVRESDGRELYIWDGALNRFRKHD